MVNRFKHTSCCAVAPSGLALAQSMAPAHSVAELLNAAQDSRGEVAWARCAGQLWKLILQDPDPHNDELLECVNLLLTVSQVRGAAVSSLQQWPTPSHRKQWLSNYYTCSRSC